MERLIHKYLDKLQTQGLADKEHAVFLALDAELVSNRPISGEVLTLSRVFDSMSISTLLFAEPSEPYKSILQEIISRDPLALQRRKVIPMDCETRTFFHDIPVIEELSHEAIARALSRRKAAIIKDRGIVTYGVVTPEQAFVSFSSTCFSLFVKYFYDFLLHAEECSRNKTFPSDTALLRFKRISNGLRNAAGSSPLPFPCKGLPHTAESVISMLARAGRAVVEHRLVDSCFGNISYVHNDTIYISQTGSSLDELECCIDAVPLDGSSSVGITASSELSAHKNIYTTTGYTAILHGHPKFSVIMSMHCLKEGCDRTVCYNACKERRYISGIPVVPGEIGTGPTGLMHTVPPAIKECEGAIVHGHGVFTAGHTDFQVPFSKLLSIENSCREEYFSKIDLCLKKLNQ
ncbi:MAG: class II aldolase/adducin family protein [Nitrospirota bacterium]